MRCSIYLRAGRVIIPTLGLAQKGLYRDIEPVTVVEVSETDVLRRAFKETFARAIRQLGRIRGPVRSQSSSSTPA